MITYLEGRGEKEQAKRNRKCKKRKQTKERTASTLELVPQSHTSLLDLHPLRLPSRAHSIPPVLRLHLSRLEALVPWRFERGRRGERGLVDLIVLLRESFGFGRLVGGWERGEGWRVMEG